MIKLLIGGSPCTFWSIAQKNNRETEAEGLGWELFKNYLIAKEKFQPDFFLYENNKSAAQAIKDQVSRELGVELMYINSALVSAQNRQRFYAFNWEVEQPEDRGILLKDILETGENLTGGDKSYALTTRCAGAIPEDTIKRHRHTMVAEPIRIGTFPNSKGEVKDAQATRIYSIDGKGVNLVANGGGQGAKTGLYAVPTKPIKVGEVGNGGQGNRIYSVDGKSVSQTATSGGIGSNTGLYAIPSLERAKDIYEVKDGLIEIKGRKFPVRLTDGYYIIRKLTPIECERLQTMPDNYTAAVSNTQRYKGLGNGWTAEVIIHILQGVLKDVPKDEEIIVLSMYDGIGTGRYCLDKMGFTNIKYYAYG